MITPEGVRNITFVGYTDSGRGDGVQVMVNRGQASIGTPASCGVMVTDVRDPRNPRPVYFAAIHPNSWCVHPAAERSVQDPSRTMNQARDCAYKGGKR